MHIRCVEDQPVPLALDVIVFRLLSDVEAVKLQLSRKFLFPFKDHQRNLQKSESKMPSNWGTFNVMMSDSLFYSVPIIP